RAESMVERSVRRVAGQGEAEMAADGGVSGDEDATAAVDRNGANVVVGRPDGRDRLAVGSEVRRVEDAGGGIARDREVVLAAAGDGSGDDDVAVAVDGHRCGVVVAGAESRGCSTVRPEARIGTARRRVAGNGEIEVASREGVAGDDAVAVGVDRDG